MLAAIRVKHHKSSPGTSGRLSLCYSHSHLSPSLPFPSPAFVSSADRSCQTWNLLSSLLLSAVIAEQKSLPPSSTPFTSSFITTSTEVESSEPDSFQYDDATIVSNRQKLSHFPYLLYTSSLNIAHPGKINLSWLEYLYPKRKLSNIYYICQIVLQSRSNRTKYLTSWKKSNDSL